MQWFQPLAHISIFFSIASLLPLLFPFPSSFFPSSFTYQYPPLQWMLLRRRNDFRPSQALLIYSFLHPLFHLPILPFPLSSFISLPSHTNFMSFVVVDVSCVDAMNSGHRLACGDDVTLRNPFSPHFSFISPSHTSRKKWQWKISNIIIKWRRESGAGDQKVGVGSVTSPKRSHAQVGTVAFPSSTLLHFPSLFYQAIKQCHRNETMNKLS